MDLTHKYNFDSDIFEKLRNDYISGAFCEKNNKLQGIISQPGQTDLVDPDKLEEHTREKNRRVHPWLSTKRNS